MLLAIDCGNTNIVFAVFDGDNLIGQWRSSTKSDKTADEFGVWLTHLLNVEKIQATDITAAIIASVVPATKFTLISLCKRFFSCEPMLVGEGDLQLGIKIGLDRPEEAGADRIVNAASAFQKYQCPMIIIDFGTATTFDVVDASGSYIGGVIAPGINLSLEALHMAAAQLPRVDICKPDDVIGNGTISAMQSGVYWGYVGLIEGLVSRIEKQMGRKMKVIATGGLASLFIEATDVIDHLENNLTITGLLEIYKRNKAV
jgi:type III pantothenate kinase